MKNGVLILLVGYTTKRIIHYSPIQIGIFPPLLAFNKLGKMAVILLWHASDGSYTPVPGDMAIQWSPPYEHINIVVGVSGTTLNLIGGDQR